MKEEERTPDTSIDLYRMIINKFGKVKIWNMNPDEVCDACEEVLRE